LSCSAVQLALCVVALITLACDKSNSSAIEPPKRPLVRRGDRLPPPDATMLDRHTWLKTLTPGLDGDAAAKEPPFSGYGFTFYSADTATLAPRSK
jgi:hypothetical protein